jgi:D-alanyl-D-alanine carboxypeptidase (penicillin-binding protein 5/6)
VDLGSGQVLFAKNPDERRPIASVTKIMTALLVLERSDLADVVTVSANASPNGSAAGLSTLGLRTGERISVRELLYALLVQSSNDAAVALAEHVSGTVGAFVTEMNRRAKQLGLRDTRFSSPNGLDDHGYSSPADLAELTGLALADPVFAKVVATRVYEIPSPSGPPRVVQNRNVLLWLYPGAFGVKTGFTTAAGYCVVASAERDGMRLLAVVLGEPGEPFSDTATLLNYGFSAFEVRALVEEGEPLGRLPLGPARVQVEAGAALSPLIPVGLGADVRRRIVAEPDAAYPPVEGERVGTLLVALRDRTLGRVPVLVSSVPPPPSPDPGPWWRRAAASVGGAVVDVLGALFS